MSQRIIIGIVLAVTFFAGALAATTLEALEVGDRAPDFDLPATTGSNIKLSQFKGKQAVLLEFYGADFAPVCADNLSARKVDYEKFRAAGVQILGISTDNVFSQKAFGDSLKLPFPLLSDRAMTATRAYGVVYGYAPGKNDYPEMKDLMSKRAFFLVDVNGIVRSKWMGEDLATFPTEPLLRAVREHGPKR